MRSSLMATRVESLSFKTFSVMGVTFGFLLDTR